MIWRKKKESYLQSQITLLFLFSGIAKIVLLQPLAVHPLNVLNCQHRPVVLIFRVLLTVALIKVNLGKGFNEILLCMGDVVLQKLSIETQNLNPVRIRIALVINTDMAVQPLLHLVQLGHHITIQCLSNRFRNLRPGVDLDGCNLNQGHQDNQDATGARQNFLDTHGYAPAFSVGALTVLLILHRLSMSLLITSMSMS